MSCMVFQLYVRVPSISALRPHKHGFPGFTHPGIPKQTYDEPGHTAMAPCMPDLQCIYDNAPALSSLKSSDSLM